MPVESDGLQQPGARAGASHRGREIRERLFAAIGHCPCPQNGQRSRGILVEIALRHGTVRVSFPIEEPPDISSIFEQQRSGLIFRMALEEDEQILSLFYERV